MDLPSFDVEKAKRILEAALLTASEPLELTDLSKLFNGELGKDVLRRMLSELEQDWNDRTIELVSVASGWRFRARPEYQQFLDRLDRQRAPRYSRAVMETLAIIAYQQPVTRGDTEEIRGVVVSSNIIKALEARGWIDTVGHREVPGRPELFGTTRLFLDHLNLRSLEELPPLEELGQLVETLAPDGSGELPDDVAVANEDAFMEGETAESAQVDSADAEMESSDASEAIVDDDVVSDEEVVIETEAAESTDVESAHADSTHDESEISDDVEVNNVQAENKDEAESDDKSSGENGTAAPDNQSH